MGSINTFISEKLAERESNNSLRHLKLNAPLIDFCSNDYLGFSRSLELKQLFETQLARYPEYKLGSTGSRLLTGNDQFTETVEAGIAQFHDSEASLLFNSGYDANVGLFSSLPQRGDTIVCDEYIHASIIDGARLSHAARFVFKHNDMESLEQKLKAAQGKIFIGIESVYSMDGDEAPLEEISNLAEKYNAALIVDEAHAIGVFGDHGRGIVEALNLGGKVFARIVTYGKALGVHGAAILGSDDLRSYLINFARSFVYTTAPSFLTNLAISTSYDYLQTKNHQQDLHLRISHFRSKVDSLPGLAKSRSGIQIILIPGNTKVKEIASRMQQEDFDVRAILSPTVSPGFERLRICLHNHNSLTEIEALCQSLKFHCES